MGDTIFHPPTTLLEKFSFPNFAYSVGPRTLLRNNLSYRSVIRCPPILHTHPQDRHTPTMPYLTFCNIVLIWLLIVVCFQNEESVTNKLNVHRSCSHSEELSYMFGAPLSYHLLGKSMTHFANNYTKAEMILSQALMTYWINFAKFG